MTAVPRLRSPRHRGLRSLLRPGTLLPVALTTVLAVGAVVATATPSAPPAPRARAVSYANGSPMGHLDVRSMTPGGLHVRGWTFDPSAPTRTVSVHATIDGKRTSSVAANGTRTDVAHAYPASGAAHGFDWKVPVSEGRHTVCVVASDVGKGSDITLGCRTTTFHYGPVGALEHASATLGHMRLTGWVIDGDAMNHPVSVRVTVDGTTRTVLADRTRTDVAKKHPNTGTAHGFDVTYALAQGTHSLCVTAVNIGYGTNTSLLCRTFTLDDRPVVGFNTLQQSAGRLRVYGWAFDRDAPTTPLSVAMTVDSRAATTLSANRTRTDVAAKYPGTGKAHGFDTSLTVPEGTHRVCITARNIGYGSDRSLGCKSIVINFTPTASLAAPVPTRTGLTLSGWASDPDTSAAVVTRLLVDNATVASVTANGKGATHSGHNFAASLTLRSGTHQVCAVAINVLYGTRNSVASCRTVTLALSPFGHYDSLARVSGSTNLLATGWALDPDTSAPTSVAVTLDGVAQPAATASVARPDVAKAYPGFGTAHGLAVTVPTDAGEHTVCLTAKNVSGGADAALGCRLINAVHPVAPAAPRSVTAQAGFGGAVVSWQAPASDGGAPWSKYTITTSAGVTVTAGASATSATVTGLKASTRYSFTVRAVNVVGSSAAVTSAVVTTQASPPAQKTPAPISTSRYIRNIRGSSASELATMRAEGASDAKNNPSGHGYMVLLDIGGQDAYDKGVVLSATTRFVGYTDLVRDVQAYLDGYHGSQRASAPVVVAIGTNNDMDVTSATGKAWAVSVVNPIASYVAARYTGMTIAGANDIEPGFRASYASTRSWLGGYLAATRSPFIFNGSADGCAWTVTNRSCNNGWTMAGLHYLAAGAAPTRMLSLPQVYNNTMADQWKYISLTGVVNGSTRINFAGVLTEYTACVQAGGCGSMSGRSAWSRMWSDLQSDARLRVGSLPYSTDLRIDR